MLLERFAVHGDDLLPVAVLRRKVLLTVENTAQARRLRKMILESFH